LEYGVSDADHETEHWKRLFEQFREGLLDLSRDNPMLNHRHRVGSRQQLRIVDCDLESLFAELAGNPSGIRVVALPERDDLPDDERTAGFLAALGRARAMDAEYLARLQALDEFAGEDVAAFGNLDGWLREHVRRQLGLPPLPDRNQFHVIEHARKHRVAPDYELARRADEVPPPISGLQTLSLADELDERLARMTADARLAEQETGLSTLFLVFGFLRWRERTGDGSENLAPLLLLPVALERQMEGSRPVYTVRALAEYPEINLSLREALSRTSPGHRLPAFDEESDGIEIYFTRVSEALAGLDGVRIDRCLTLGQFAFGRVATYAELAAENWPAHPASLAPIQSVLGGWQAVVGDAAAFAPDHDLDDDRIEDAAAILIDDADASQHSVIVDVMKGRSFAVEGPPGSGKSQTVANIVANALYAGKTVLFLADKLAALQTVKGRMDAAGLGDFCLELHSDRAQTKSIVLDLQRRYEMGRDRGYEPAWSIDLRKLRKARSRVREYLGALHAVDPSDGRTPFALFWSAIAGRREFSREFSAVRSIDLSEIFAGRPEKLKADADALKQFAAAAEGYEKRFGQYAEAAWTKANFTPAADCDVRQIADFMRDVQDAALRLLEAVAARAAKLQIEIPRAPARLAEWIAAVRRLPVIPDDALLARVSSFAPGEIMAAAELARSRLADENADEQATMPVDPAAVGSLAQQAAAGGVGAATPAEVAVRARKMAELGPSLQEGFAKISALVAAFGSANEPDVAAGKAMAEVVLIAATIPPHLDQFLWFDGAGHEDVLLDGAQRARLLKETERALDEKFQRDGRGEWPPIEELRIAARVASATGLRPLASLVTGQRARANQVLRALGVGTDTPDLGSDLETLIFHIEARERLRADKRLAAAAGPFWAEFATPFGELAAVARLRSAYEASAAALGEVGTVLKSNLFSSNAKFVEKLRSYRPWAAKFLSDLDAWPEQLAGTALRQAASSIEERTAELGRLADRVRELGLADVETPFETLRRNADRRLQRFDLDAKIAGDPVLAAVGEATWRSAGGCDALRDTATLFHAIAAADPPPGVRARLNSADGPSFARLLEGSIVSIGLALERYRRDAARLVAAGLRLDADDEDPAQVADFLALLLSELPSLGEWLEATRRRAHVVSLGLGPLIAAFEQAGLPFQRLAGTFAALEVFYRAVLARRRHPALQNAKGKDIETERRRFAAADQAFKPRQREAVRIKLLGNAVPTGTCAGRKRDWTELQCIRNELTKSSRHIPVRALLGRARRAIQAMKPCLMASPLSLAKYLPPQAMSFDLLVIDEASQMRAQDALGALLRAKQVVVFGDRNQLPSTDVFTRIKPADEFGLTAHDRADDGDRGSIFDWALQTHPAPRRLECHYRSRCESLIAFSRREFYASPSRDLVTFPNVRPGSFSIDLVRVDGSYKAGRNPAEVGRIVEAAIEFMTRNAGLPPEEIPTLAIAATSIEQRDAIRDEFDRAPRNAAVERYLAACNAATATRISEPFFVKDLENLQGDERDVIMISLTYGPEGGQARLSQRFGPIAGGEGHRRLNVLFTRARQRVVLFSSIGSNDVVVNAGGARGVRLLRDYLRYVEGRQLEAGAVPPAASDFAREIRSRLEAQGYSVDTAVGAGAGRVEVAVRHPRDPAVYLAAIESDGGAFRRAHSARERDRLRESVLAALGWNVLRAWSTDWFSEPQAQTAQLVEDLARLAQQPADEAMADSKVAALAPRAEERDGSGLVIEASGASRALVEARPGDVSEAQGASA
jgi:hypothetical protein